MWLCPQCGLENSNHRVVCESCDGIKVNEVGWAERTELDELLADGAGI